MLRRENEKNLDVGMGEYHPLLLFEIHIKIGYADTKSADSFFQMEVFPKPCADIFRIIKLRKRDDLDL
jgi:hypothetical protein